MILHIGNNIVILKKDILAILNRETMEESEDNKNLISKLIQDKKLKNKIDGEIKSYIILAKDRELELYLSNISSNTLLKRKVL